MEYLARVATTTANGRRLCLAAEAAVNGDLEGALAIYDPDVTWVAPDAGPDVGVFHGHTGLVEAWLRWVRAFDDYYLHVEPIEEFGNQVLSLWRDGGIGRASAVPVERSGASVHTFLGGKVVHVRQFASEAEARAALGGES